MYVDEQRQSVVLPVYGYAVPFHISTIKNVTKTEESDQIVLRINFQSPGQIAGKKEDMVGDDCVPDKSGLTQSSHLKTPMPRSFDQLLSDLEINDT